MGLCTGYPLSEFVGNDFTNVFLIELGTQVQDIVSVTPTYWAKQDKNKFYAKVHKYIWDDLMVHGMRIKDGKATYVSRYIKTSRLKQEEFFGGSNFMKIGDLKGLFGLFMVNMQILRAKLKVLDVSYGRGTGNTALIYHQGKLLALSEVDKPCKSSCD
ncbi:carotenoid 9,10(9',10')-cleavage dioxygenase-like [Magnolia sinica]|uniref:carotenoid 9,10(9',10')-cleavage dioxygenase-like n=1 Tax=Magnolia sinica TaxID=86752 RepID=UPI00265B2A03|nr:carotenoid 9,10(9',10')-cleavage dioxygenase-like [Magnolia sinica]